MVSGVPPDYFSSTGQLWGNPIYRWDSFGMYSAACFVFSFALPSLAARIGRKGVHALCLICGSLGLLSVAVIHDKWLLFVSLAGVGIAWASILSMPYAILSGSLPPEKTGTYMGIFNFFITLPEIIASLAFGSIMNALLGNNRLLAVIGGGFFLILAAILVSRVRIQRLRRPWRVERRWRLVPLVERQLQVT